MRVKVSVSIDQKIYEKAHSLGINVSKASENALLAIIEAIENTHNPKQPVSVDAFPEKRVKWTGRDLNPRLLDCEAKFFEWLVKDGAHKSYVARYMVSYAKQFQHCLVEKRLDSLLQLSSGKKRLVMASLSALSKFLGVYDDWKQLVKQYNLKWSGQSKDDIVINRMNDVRVPDEIWRWVVDVKRELPEFTVLMDLMATTGLRFGEAVNSYNLIIQLSKEGKLGSYYVHDKATLEHYRFKELFLRHTKKAFISFVPFELIDRISKAAPLNLYGVQTAVKRMLPLRFSDVREAHGTFLTKFLKPSEIDFLHGRVTGSVFMANYFNPSIIGDLKARVFQGINEIQEKISVG